MNKEFLKKDSIRKAEPKDARSIIDIIKSVHIDKGINRSEGFLASRDLSEESYIKMIEKYEYCYVFEIDKKVAGFLIVSSSDSMDKASEIYSYLAEINPHEDFNYIFQVAVDRKFKRMGIATMLYNRLFDDCGGKLMVITSKNPLNQASRNFHLKLGFRGMQESLNGATELKAMFTI